MENEKKFIITIMAEAFAYEMLYIYNLENVVPNVNYVFNSLGSHLVFKEYKEEIISLGTSIATILFEIPIK